MPKLSDDPKVQALVAKEVGRAVKAERVRILGLFKDHQTETLDDPLLDASIKKSYKRLSTQALTAAKAASQEA